jgi:alkylation response protein AidB-like acyl-CoA dehydrogenase
VGASAACVDACYTAGGGAAVYETSPLQRVFRDVHVATQHAMVAPRTMEVVGRSDLGLPTDLRQL